MIETILLNAETVLAWVGGIVSCASIIVKLTPTTKDDSVLEKVVNFLDYFSIFNTKKNQEKLDK
jgi:hypothetical protein